MVRNQAAGPDRLKNKETTDGAYRAFTKGKGCSMSEEEKTVFRIQK